MGYDVEVVVCRLYGPQAVSILAVLLCIGCGGVEACRSNSRWESLESWATIPRNVGVDSLTGLPARLVHTATRAEMILVSPGEYTRGAPDEDLDATPAEKPAHQARVRAHFYLSKFEVTRSMWARTARVAAAPDDDTGDLPVTDLIRVEINQFLAATGLRLPTEVEWEFACRATTRTSRYGRLDDIAWTRGNCDGVQAVGSKLPNAWGFYDMLGNAWEIAAYPDDSGFNERSGLMWDVINFNQEQTQSLIVVRGGSALLPEADCRASARSLYRLGPGCSAVGFRVAITAPMIAVHAESHSQSSSTD